MNDFVGIVNQKYFCIQPPSQPNTNFQQPSHLSFGLNLFYYGAFLMGAIGDHWSVGKQNQDDPFNSLYAKRHQFEMEIFN